MLDQFPAQRAEAVRLMEHGQYDAAASLLYRHLTANPSDLFALANLGKACYFAGHADEAARIFRVLRERRPEPVFLNWLGLALSAQNRMDEAAGCFREAVARDERAVDAWANLARIHRFRPGDPLLARLKRLTRAKWPSDVERQHLLYALAKALNDVGRPDDAWEAAARGAEAAMPEHRPAETERAVDAVIRTYTADVLRPRRGRGVETGAPVFIVGMPRSGTTLIEQILSRHPSVAAAGELTVVPQVVRGWMERPVPAGAPRSGPDWALAVPDAEVAAGAQRWLDAVRRRAGGVELRRAVDKMPSNVLHLGPIAMMFPQARIIFAERDPRDIAVSCWFTRFTSAHEYSYRLDWLGHQIGQTARVADHYRAVLPNRWTTLRYEALVAEPEAEIRRLLAFLDLDWDPACLQPERSGGTVITASVGQVRRAINAGSVGRWRRYQRHLGPLCEALADAVPPERISPA